MVHPRVRALAALGVAATALVLYRSTLLLGVDFGDTGSFQATIGSALITPRDGYPLYFAVANLFSWLHPADPAHTLNLVSAIEAAAACGIMVVAATEVSGSVLAAVAAALVFAGSYTFWSQALIAEVYALHAVFVALTVWLVVRWSKRPTFGRLAAVLAVYALGFGNHLSMILLAPGLTVFALTASPGGWRSMCRPRVLALAAACAVGGALQYLWNVRTLWMLPFPPASVAEALRHFWFDVTKVDWRATMVLQVPRTMRADHASMYAFDLHQQFGWIVPAVAAIGLLALVRTQWRTALFLLLLWTVNVVFAFEYNVGDTHVFYLPSHQIIALLAAPGLVAVGRFVEEPRVIALLMSLYAAIRIYDDYPALDRSGDWRPTGTLEQITTDLDDTHDVLIADLNWQVQNGLSYFTKAVRPDVAVARMNDVALYLPRLVADNEAIGRRIVLTPSARATALAAFGPLLPIDHDHRTRVPSLRDTLAQLPPGTRYVLCLLKPTRGDALDWTDLGAALATIAGGSPVPLPNGDYVVIAGVTAAQPVLIKGANRPFRQTVSVDGVDAEVRMESWLAADTIRRMGFGHVIVNRHHTLIVERGVSFVAFDPAGAPILTRYAGGLFASGDRYLVGRETN